MAILDRLGFGRRRRAGAGAIDYPTRWGVVAAWEALTDLADSHGAHTLTAVNTPTAGAAIAAGLGASAQLVAADTDLFTAADHAELSAANVDLAISFWVTFDTLGADRGLIYKGTGAASTTLEFSVRYISATGRFRMDWGDAAGAGAVPLTLSNSGAIAAETPYHVLVYHSAAGDLIGGIVNGGTANEAATSGKVPTDTAGLFRIGAFNQANASPCDGRVSDVTVMRPASMPAGVADMTALAVEIAARIYAAGTGRGYPFS